MTDEYHLTTIYEIKDYLQSQHIAIKDPRTIRNDITNLSNFGIDIVEQRKQQYQYFVGTRHFEAPEVKLLVDAVQSSRFITARKSKALIEKLSAFVGPSQADVLNRQLYVEQRAKADNESIYITVDRIQTAIAHKQKIEFQYYEYLPSKKKQLKHGGLAYELSPYAMLWNNNSYYVAGYSARHGKIVKYRVDRIERLEILDEPQIPPADDFDVSGFFSQEFSMLDGTPCEVTLLCENALMNSIIDRFGEGVETRIADSSHFEVKATENLISGKLFDHFKKGAVLVNAARGAIVNEDDLYEALVSGKLKAAACDTFVNEPPTIENRLLSLANFSATPHIGGNTEESLRRTGMEVVQETLNVLSGKEPLHAVV